MIGLSPFVIQAEQYGADSLLFLGCVAESAHNAIRRADALDLLHAIAIPGVIRLMSQLGNYTIKAKRGESGDPFLCLCVLTGRWRDAKSFFGGASSDELREEMVQCLLPLGERHIQKRFVGRIDQQIKTKISARRLAAEALDARLARMDALQQGIKIQMVIGFNHDLAIEDELVRA